MCQSLTRRCIRSFSSGFGGDEPKQGGRDVWQWTVSNKQCSTVFITHLTTHNRDLPRDESNVHVAQPMNVLMPRVSLPVNL